MFTQNSESTPMIKHSHTISNSWQYFSLNSHMFYFFMVLKFNKKGNLKNIL